MSKRLTYLEKQEESNPLIVLDMLLILLISGLVYSWMRNIDTNSLPVSRTESVGGMDPAVGVQHLLRYVVGVDTHDWCSNILSRGDDKCKS